MAGRNVYVRFSVTGANRVKSEINSINSALRGFERGINKFKSMPIVELVIKAFEGLKEGFDVSVAASAAFEKSLTAVQRRSGASATWIRNFGDEIKDLSENIPQTAEDLLSIAENASQLGIANKDLLSFTEVMAGIGSVTNMSANDAATAFARMANIMHTSAADYERIGSTVLYLGSNFATTEQEIADFSLTLAAVGKAYKLTEAEVLGLGTAMSSLGITSSSGATSINRTFQAIESAVRGGTETLATFAETAGMTADEFSEMWQSNRMSAFTKWLEGLQGSEYLFGTLAESGIRTQKTIKDIQALSAGYATVARAVEEAGDAWAKNTELAAQTGIQYGTTASKMQEAENAVNNLKIAIGDKLMPIERTWLSLSTETAQEMENVVNAYTGLGMDIDRINLSYEASVAGLERNFQTVGTLIDQIDEIGDVEKGTQAWLDRIAAMEEIKRLMPQISGGMNLETGEIEGGTAGLRQQAEATKDLTAATIEYQRASEGMEALTIAQERLADMNTLRAVKYAELSEAGKAALNTLEAYEEQYKRKYASGQLTDEWIGEYEWETSSAKDQISAEEGGLELYRLDQRIEAHKKQIDEFSDSIIEAAEATAEAVGMETEAISEQEKAAAADLGNLQTALENYNNTFYEAKNAAIEALENGALGNQERTGAKAMFAWGDNEERPGDARDINTTLKNNADAMNEYAESLQKAQEMGLEGDALANLADGTKYSAEILKSLTEGGPEAIQEYMDNVAEMQTAEDNLATAMAEASGAMQDAQAELDAAAQAASESIQTMVDESDKSAEASSATGATMKGLISGIDAYIGTLGSKVRQVRALTAQLASLGGGSGTGHAQGLEYVPRDDYFAVLHRGEMVLSSAAARAYREERRMNFAMLQRATGGGSVTNINDSRRTSTQQTSTINHYHIGTIEARREIDIDEMAKRLNRRNAGLAHGFGR